MALAVGDPQHGVSAQPAAAAHAGDLAGRVDDGLVAGEMWSRGVGELLQRDSRQGWAKRQSGELLIQRQGRRPAAFDLFGPCPDRRRRWRDARHLQQRLLSAFGVQVGVAEDHGRAGIVRLVGIPGHGDPSIGLGPAPDLATGHHSDGVVDADERRPEDEARQMSGPRLQQRQPDGAFAARRPALVIGRPAPRDPHEAH
jgi:hypothetical protein